MRLRVLQGMEGIDPLDAPPTFLSIIQIGERVVYRVTRVQSSACCLHGGKPHILKQCCLGNIVTDYCGLVYTELCVCSGLVLSIDVEQC